MEKFEEGVLLGLKSLDKEGIILTPHQITILQSLAKGTCLCSYLQPLENLFPTNSCLLLKPNMLNTAPTDCAVLILSPLVGIMKEQTSLLQKAGVCALHIQGLTAQEKEDLRTGHFTHI